MADRNTKILLLNPPARRPVLRDYYHSTRPKVNYLWQPIDLLSVAALLESRAEIKIIDAIALRLSYKKTLSLINEFDPDTIFALVSTITKTDDLNFIKKTNNGRRRFVIGGEVALDSKFDFEKYSFVDGLIMDFTSKTAVNFLLGELPSGRIRTRDHTPTPSIIKEMYSIGIMPHAALPGGNYRLPLWRGNFFSLLTDFGCPFSCTFCNSGVGSLGFKLRDHDEIAEELKILKRLGARQLYLRDMTFGSDKKHVESVLKLLEPYQFSLRGYLRANLVTKEFARKLKYSGFDIAQIGIESPSSEMRRMLGKNIDDCKITEAFQILQDEGIRVGAHFVLGFEGEKISSITKCLKMARDINALYCSINIYQPRLGIEPIYKKSSTPEIMMSLGAKICMLRYNIKKYLNFIITSKEM
jgi:radical SAM superfamily enzyme YgiQ (UPF0313 family)